MKPLTIMLRRLVLIVAVVWSVFPVAWMVLAAVRDRRQLLANPNSISFDSLSLESWSSLGAMPDFWSSMGRSFAISSLATAGTLLLAASASYSLARFRVRGMSILRHASLWAYLFAPVVLVVPMFIILKRMGINDTLTGLVLAHVAFCFPFGMWLLYPFMRAMPRGLEESAAADGATRLQTIARIVIPLARPGLIAVGIFCFTLSWSDYLFARVLVGSHLRTLPVFIYDLSTSTVVDWGVLMAAAVASVAPVMFLILFAHRHVATGLAHAGIRG